MPRRGQRRANLGMAPLSRGETMMRAILAMAFLSLTAGCKESGPEHQSGSGAASSAPAETVFRGTYRSTWGDTVFSQAGAVVVARYPDGTLDCMATGTTLDCSWKEGTGFGKASLTRQANGTLQGTWGNAASDKDGGQWTFVPK
jgi:hypothetical protein